MSQWFPCCIAAVPVYYSPLRHVVFLLTMHCGLFSDHWCSHFFTQDIFSFGHLGTLHNDVPFNGAQYRKYRAHSDTAREEIPLVRTLNEILWELRDRLSRCVMRIAPQKLNPLQKKHLQIAIILHWNWRNIAFILQKTNGNSAAETHFMLCLRAWGPSTIGGW